MSSGKRWSFRRVFTANGSCGGCGRKATDIVEPKSKSEISSNQKNRHCDSSAALSEEYCRNSAAISPDINRDPDGAACSETAAKIRNSLPVVKVSDDPYRDFRQSMIQMIFENEIYTGDDLQQLLCCFLELNSPHHHEVIVKAFLEICNSCADEESTPPCSSADTTSN